jgi:hypothetical protein
MQRAEPVTRERETPSRYEMNFRGLLQIPRRRRVFGTLIIEMD